MRINRNIIKISLKLITVVLALVLLLIQVYYIFFEEEILFTNKLVHGNTVNNMAEAQYCEEFNKTKYLEILFKCLLAFSSGCLLSEMRFIKTGVL